MCPLEGRKKRAYLEKKKHQMTIFMLSLPAILKPDFDLLGFDIGQNGTLADQLLPPQRARLRTLGINPFEGFDLLGGVPDIFSGSVEMLVDATTATLSVLLCHHHRYFRNSNSNIFPGKAVLVMSEN